MISESSLTTRSKTGSNKMKIETLTCGDLTAMINLSRGANCIALTHSTYGADILRQPNYEALDNPYLYGMPILFPVNRISGGSFSFDGRTYHFPVNEPKTGCALHGSLHESAFEVTEQSENHITCLYASSQTEDFPHDFEVELAYILTENGLTQKTTVRNKSDTRMPVFLGFHTTFNVPFIKEGKTEDVRILAEVGDFFERDTNYLPTGTILPEDAVTEAFRKGDYISNERLSRHYKATGKGALVLTDIKHGIKLEYSGSENLPFRLIYSEGSGFICLEPQTCLANAPNSPFDRDFAGFAYLAPQSESHYFTEIKITKLS